MIDRGNSAARARACALDSGAVSDVHAMSVLTLRPPDTPNDASHEPESR
jgi:hypothetical protein